MIIPSFAIAPDETKGDKTKIENLSPPPPTWTLRIHIMDANGSCLAQGCNLGILVQSASSDCISIATDPSYIIPYVPGSSDYTLPIPADITCVFVSIIDVPVGSCNYPLNLNTCCECKDMNNICKLFICP